MLVLRCADGAAEPDWAPTGVSTHKPANNTEIGASHRSALPRDFRFIVGSVGSSEILCPPIAITGYFAGVVSNPRYFSIAFELGGAPRHFSYILARSSVLPRERIIWRKRSPLARLSSPCSLNHW